MQFAFALAEIFVIQMLLATKLGGTELVADLLLYECEPGGMAAGFHVTVPVVNNRRQFMDVF